MCQDRLNHNIYYIQLGNVRFPLELETLKVLIEIVDDFANVYLDYLLEINAHTASHLFQPANHNNGFRLFKIEKWLWDLLISFSLHFDYDRGTSAWHIFNSNYAALHIYNPIGTERFNSGDHVSVYSERVDDELYDASNKAWIVWVPGFSFNEYDSGYSNFSGGEFWDASFTYDWLTQELIPHVLYYDSLREERLLNSFKLKLSSIQKINQFLYKNFLKKFNLRNYISDGSVEYDFIEIEKIQTSSDLFQNAYKLQSIFTMQRDKTPIETEKLLNLLESLCIYIRHSLEDDWHYIRDKLSFVGGDGDNKESIIQDILRFGQAYN